MANTIQIDIPVMSAQQGEILIAELSEISFHGFEENDSMVSAFINEDIFEEDIFKSILSKLNVSFTKRIIADNNWNQKWENEFLPVVINSFVAVRATFHSPVKGVKHEIIITPKMSFGTGHHATTFLMLQQMEEIDFKNKSVLDFGTGTGILAILASKLGANKITAIDNDDYSIQNAKENFYTNNCGNISLIKSDSINDFNSFDIILANINLNVIKANITGLKKASNEGTKLLLSGFLQYDEKELKQLFSSNSFQLISVKEKDGWISMMLYLEKD
jgi:ribosomal protein L11 methyltransferase